MNFFKRVEKKYLLTDSEYKKLMKKLESHLEKDSYFKSTICNIYLDNDNYDVIKKSLEKPPFKEKIRLRSYNVPELNDDVYLELKGKINGIVFKRRIKLKLNSFYNYIDNNVLPEESQIMREIDYKIKHLQLKPKLYLAYDRFSYYDKENHELRITFDENIRSREENLHLEYGDAGKLYFKENMHIMEIKTLGALPLWFTKIITDLKIYPVSFSKYGSIYKEKIKEKLSYV
jgi:SPX domain protein involved in polyphosphate accumulation